MEYTLSMCMCIVYIYRILYFCYWNRYSGFNYPWIGSIKLFLYETIILFKKNILIVYYGSNFFLQIFKTGKYMHALTDKIRKKRLKHVTIALSNLDMRYVKHEPSAKLL